MLLFRYQPENNDEDDEHDDYGFNRRPNVRGIKPRFGTTNEILQQIQNQLQPPVSTPPRAATTQVAWPYYSETGLSSVDNAKSRNINMPPYQYPQQYRPTSLIEENLYQNCTNQRCAVTYRTNMNSPQPVMRVGGGCNEYYQSLPRARTGRPQSPPPQEVSKNYHQTMVYIPYNHIEGYQQPTYYSNEQVYSRVSNQNQINKRYIEPVYQSRISQAHLEDHYATMPKTRVPFVASTNHLNRSESPLPGQFSTARSTQTPAATLTACNYYPANAVRYRPMVGPINPHNGMIWQGDYVTKVNRHSFPGAPRYPLPDVSSDTDKDPGSPTKPRFIERGVPEGAASVSPQDTNTQSVTSPTSPQNPPGNPQKPLFYAMNV